MSRFVRHISITLPALLLQISCGDSTTEKTSFALEFAAKVGGQDFACGQSYPSMGAPATTIQSNDFRFFVSHVYLVNADGKVELELDQDTPWQHDRVALLDFENGTAGCAETGNADLNRNVVGMAPGGTYTGVEFELGVPADLNHSNTADAPSPLNVVPMNWNWRGGYKFLRLDLSNENPAPMNKWNIHLGSTACDSPAATQAPAAACAKPNRPKIQISDFDPAVDVINADLGALLTGVDVTTNTSSTPPGCMSGPADANECPGVFSNLGLSYASGDCEGACAGQTFFGKAQ